MKRRGAWCRNGAADADRARRRIELWSLTFRALYGAPSGENLPGLAPGALPDRRLQDHPTRAQLVARPLALRRLLAPLTIAGDTSSTTNDAEFRALAIAATRDLSPAPRSFDEALRALREYATAQLGVRPASPAQVEAHTFARLLAAEELLAIEPANVAQLGGVTTVSRRARFRMPFKDIATRINPKNWLQMGPFFEYVAPVEGEFYERKDGWDGLFEEIVILAWDRFQLQTFHTFLKVDYTEDVDRARADYSLVYEVDDQFERDCGYLEVKRIPGRLDWCQYYGEKSTRFRSPLSNITAPMMAATFLESGLSAMEDETLRRVTGPQHDGKS